MGARHPHRFGMGYGGQGSRVEPPNDVIRYPRHEDPIKALLGEPRDGESALDKRLTGQSLPKSQKRFRVDWSKMSATGDRGVAYHTPKPEGDTDGD